MKTNAKHMTEEAQAQCSFVGGPESRPECCDRCGRDWSHAAHDASRAQKKVLIAIEVDREFVSLLKNEIELGKIREKAMGEYGRNTGLTPSQQLALVALAEMRGATEAEIWALTMPHWRPHIEVKHELRKVTQIRESRGVAP